MEKTMENDMELGLPPYNLGTFRNVATEFAAHV